MFSKILVANRGEIATRACRAAHEVGARAVAIYPFEDRFSEHRFNADEAHLIGDVGYPVHAYLDPQVIVGAAAHCGADAIYPGYGFLSENPALAQACADAGITFVGPPAPVLELTGNKAAAIAAAAAVGLPTLRSVLPSNDIDELLVSAQGLAMPVFVKAVAGGGGRGVRYVIDSSELRTAIAACMREAEAAFGDPTVFVEQAVPNPRHIEVQVLADSEGDVVHLFERDCSVQRRHQKVVEIAPAPGLDADLRQRLCDDAVRYARSIGYRNAGTVEFLVDPEGRHAFIEMNPRIQVEHTVTEEITGVDLVQAQLRVAAGATLRDLALSQDTVVVRGSALQCRITTEDPANGFRPDTGIITAYRAPAGPGVRMDSSTAYVGAEVSPHFDSLLAKLTCRGATFEEAVGKARRALAEFTIGGVSTNLSFLVAVLADPDFASGAVNTSFIDTHPELTSSSTGPDAAEGLLAYLGEVTVNRPFGRPPTVVDPVSKLPALDTTVGPAEGSRQQLAVLGPAEFAAALRVSNRVAVTDTTFRDAHQSLLATRVRTTDLLAVAHHVSRLTPELWSLEAWGGATFDAALRFLAEDPWERLDRLRAAVPNICLQMLLRGRNTVGYTPYPDRVAHAFVAEAARSGIDVFRIFDALNDVEQMRPAIDAVRETGTAVAEVALCYTGDLSSPRERLYTLDYYLNLAERIVESGAHVLAIKDMAGLLRAPAARTLVVALRREFDLPVHLHTHDTTGGQMATLLAAIDVGVDAVDAACASMAGGTSQPSLSALVAMTERGPRPTDLDLDALLALEPYWDATRRLYAPFEGGLSAPTGRVYAHEIPGGQLSNLRQQAIALGLSDRFEAIEDMYAAANRILGNLVKVTPSSKVVGDLALHLVAAGADPRDFAADPGSYDLPESVIGFLCGELGTPPGGWPEPFRTQALAGRRRGPDRVRLTWESERGLAVSPRSTLNQLLFPGPARDMGEMRRRYGDLTGLPTRQFLYGLEEGVECEIALADGGTVSVVLLSVGEQDQLGQRSVMCVVNGHLRLFRVIDTTTGGAVSTAERADPADPRQVCASYQGTVSVAVKEGDEVAVGDVVATIEAMKMEAEITAQCAGTVARVLVATPRMVEPRELIVVLD